MSDSKELFEDFIIARCEEIVEDDAECSKLNKEIAAIEDSIKKHLDKQQYKLFLQNEKLMVGLQTRICTLVYKQGLDDRIKRTGV